MTQYYDDQGEPVEGVLPPEEIASLKEQMAEKEAELNKLKDKDYNFSSLRKKTAEEREELTKTWNSAEKGLLSHIDELNARLDARDKATIGKTKETKFEELAGTDKELRDKLEFEFERLGGNTSLSDAEVLERIEEAKVLVELKQGKAMPNFVAPSGGKPSLMGDKKANEQEVQDLAKLLGVSEAINPKK